MLISQTKNDLAVLLVKKSRGEILLIAIFVFSFIAGILFNYNFILSIFCLVVAVCSQIIREKSQANIKGEGIRKITVSDKEPLHPEKGDLWIETDKNKNQIVENSNKK
jgi:hypothetical protein